MINYDEWGGFFDHVPPKAASIPPADQAAGNQDGLRGFRTSALLISPFARREAVSSVELDHTSILKMIEWRWGLESLTVRDAEANDLASALDFASPDFAAKAVDVPTGPFENECPGIASPSDAEWLPLLVMAAQAGWPVDLSLLP